MRMIGTEVENGDVQMRANMRMRVHKLEWGCENENDGYSYYNDGYSYANDGYSYVNDGYSY